MKFLVCVVLVLSAETIISSAQQVWLAPCKADADCDKIVNATCVNEFCNCGGEFLACPCKEGFIAAKSKKKCLRSVGTVLGTRCDISDDCSRSDQETMNGLVCSDGQCKCGENYTEENGQCIGTNSGTPSSTSRLKDFAVPPVLLLSFITLLFSHNS